VALLYGIVERYGVANLLIATAISGVLLFAIGALRMGNLIRFIPVSIVIGFTNGIAVIIALQQVKYFLGLSIEKMPSNFFSQIAALAGNLGTFNPTALLMGVGALAIIVVWPKSYKANDAVWKQWAARVPGTLVVLALGTVLVGLFGLQVETIGSRFGGIPRGLPSPALPQFDWEQARNLVGPIVSITLLGAIESLLCARVADGMIGDHHDPNQELMAQGAANFVVPFFGGMPATGTIARTVVNVKSGATSPVAGIVHAGVLLLVILAAAPLAASIPLATLAAILMFVAVKQQTFKGMFTVMFLWSLLYAATLPLVNAILFRHVVPETERGLVFLWAPVAWALVGYFLTGWRNVRGGEGDGSDCLLLSAVLGALMVVACVFAPTTPPAGSTGEIPIIGALGHLARFDFLVFVLASMAVAGMMQFYFLGSARFMTDMGIPGKNVPATMGIAQAAQAIATFLVLGWSVQQLGYQWTLVIGAACWLLMYLVYVAGQPRSLIVVSQALHGLAYVLFIIAGQMFAAKVDPRASMQGLIFVATTGIGLFLGTQLAGITMDKYSVNGQFQWRKIWVVPLVITLVGTLVLATIFQAETPAAPADQAAAAIATELPHS